MQEILAAKGGIVGEKFVRKFCLNSDFHVNLWMIYMPQIYDMGPTASARFERANLGSKSQQATPRPPKPCNDPMTVKFSYCILWKYNDTA